MKCTRLVRLTCIIWSLSIALQWSTPATGEQFSIVVIPDTQFYSATAQGAQISASQTQWVQDNAAAENIIYVAQLGDLVDSPAGCHGGPAEWARADAAMDILDAASIPYGVLPGNHDFDPTNPVTNTCLSSTNNYNGIPGNITGFGPARFSGLGVNYGNEDGTNDNNYILFSSPGGVEFIAINLAYSASSGPAEATILAWVEGLLQDHPDRKAIITSHFIQKGGGSGECAGAGDFGVYGADIVGLLSDNPNILMVLSAHCRGEKWITYTNSDAQRSCLSDVNLMMSNYQDYNQQNNNDSGFMRILRIDTDTVTNNIDVETFSPWIAPPDPHPGTFAATGTPTTAANMDADSVANFSFSHNFNESISPSVVLLLDSSGSMAWDVEGTPGVGVGEQRITFARQSSQAFLDLISSIFSNPQKVQFGLVGFPGSSSPFTPSAEVLTPLTPLNTASRNQAVNVTLPGINPSGSTPMLTGVEAAAELLEPQLCKSILLLSDGYHNSPTTISVGDSEVTNLINQIDTDSANPVPVYAVSFGKKETNDFALLEALATSTGGEFHDATTPDFDAASWNPATALDATFGKIIQDVFQEVEMGLDPLDTIYAGEKKSFDMPINEHDTRVSFFVSWRTLEPDLLSVRVFDSNGKPVSTTESGVNVVHGQSYTIFTVNDAALHAKKGRIGQKPWRVAIGFKRLDNRKREPLQYSVYLQSGLKFSANIAKQAYAAGDKIRLTAKLTQGRRPLAGLKRVNVAVSAPGDGNGNWLSKHPVSAEQLAKVPEKKGSETRAPFIRKAIYLSDIAAIERPTQKKPQMVTLFDDGSHGDKHAKDGIYTNSFAATNKEGIYSFHFRSKGKTARGNSFHRERRIQKYLSIRAAAEHISIDATRLPRNGNNKVRKYAITVEPKDALGNYVGPGRSSSIRLDTKKGKFRGQIQDMLDGSYSRNLYIPRSTTAREVKIRVKVGDTIKYISLDEAIGNAKPGKRGLKLKHENT